MFLTFLSLLAFFYLGTPSGYAADRDLAEQSLSMTPNNRLVKNTPAFNPAQQQDDTVINVLPSPREQQQPTPVENRFSIGLVREYLSNFSSDEEVRWRNKQLIKSIPLIVLILILGYEI